MLVYQFTRAGHLHGYSEERNQDSILSRQTERDSVIALADGVSECAEARRGAEIANESIVNFLLCPESRGRDIAKRALSFVLRELEDSAANHRKNVEDYSSTFAAVRLERGTGKLTLLNLGDGLILALRGERCRVLSMPGDSRYGCACTTTRNAFRLVDVGEADAAEMDAVIICSDGAWRLMYEGTRIKRQVRSMLWKADYRSLARYLETADGADDCSFIVMDWKREGSAA